MASCLIYQNNRITKEIQQITLQEVSKIFILTNLEYLNNICLSFFPLDQEIQIAIEQIKQNGYYQLNDRMEKQNSINAGNTMSIEIRVISWLDFHLSRFENTCIWIREHPTAVKTLKLASLIVGLGLMNCARNTKSVYGKNLIARLVITGRLLTIASTVAWLTLDLFVPPRHDMKKHIYKPAQCEGGRLYYEGDVPVLCLNSQDPFMAGKAHGYLCGEAINRLTSRLGSLIHTLARQPQAAQLPKTISAIREVIPSHYLREMEGLISGYNQWAKECHLSQISKKLVVDDLILFHLLPDSLHFDPHTFEHGVKKSASMKIPIACSAIVNRNVKNELTFARNMDWPSCGVVAACSLVINRRQANGGSSVELGLPGYIGTMTGMNNKGLSLAMNICSGTTKQIRGMPAGLFNRTCLETCQSLDDVENFLLSHTPLGPYHLTLADPNQAKSIHFYQSTSGTHIIRHMDDRNSLTTLNCRYTPQPIDDMHYSEQRKKIIDTFFQSQNGRPTEDVLSLPFVNNWLTTHRVIMQPTTKTFKVAFDNAFAGKAPLHNISTHNLLS